jgi:hypothetical protein
MRRTGCLSEEAVLSQLIGLSFRGNKAYESLLARSRTPTSCRLETLLLGRRSQRYKLVAIDMAMHRLGSPLPLPGRTSSAWSALSEKTGAQRTAPILEYASNVLSNHCVLTRRSIVFVHGCRNHRNRSTARLEKNLIETAQTIDNQHEEYRVYVFGYDASRVLHKGKEKLERVSQQLLTHMKDNCVRIGVVKTY